MRFYRWPVLFSCLLVAGAVASCAEQEPQWHRPQTNQPIPALAPPAGVEAILGTFKPPAVTSYVEAYDQARAPAALMRRQDVTQAGNGYYDVRGTAYTSRDCILYSDSIFGAGRLLELSFKGTHSTGTCNPNWGSTGGVTPRLYDVKGSLSPLAVGDQVSFKSDAITNRGNATGAANVLSVVGKLDRFDGAGVSVDGPIWVLRRNNRVDILYSEKLGLRVLETVQGESIYEVVHVTPTPEAAPYVRNKMTFSDERSFESAAATWRFTAQPQAALGNARR